MLLSPSLICCQKSTELRDRVMDNANYFRAKLTEAGFDLKPSESAICALMLYDAVLFSTIRCRITERKTSMLPDSTTRLYLKDKPVSVSNCRLPTHVNNWIVHWLPSSRLVKIGRYQIKKITPTPYKTV